MFLERFPDPKQQPMTYWFVVACINLLTLSIILIAF